MPQNRFLSSDAVFPLTNAVEGEVQSVFYPVRSPSLQRMDVPTELMRETRGMLTFSVAFFTLGFSSRLRITLSTVSASGVVGVCRTKQEATAVRGCQLLPLGTEEPQN